MIHKITAVLVVVLFSGTEISSAQTRRQVDFWENAVKTSSLQDISRQMNDSAVPRWPLIASSYAVQKFTSDENQLGVRTQQIASSLAKKMADDFTNSGENPTKEQIEAEVTTYTRIADAVATAGGYTNLLLADNARRLSIFRVSGWLAFHPENTSESEKLVAYLNAPSVSMKALLPCLADQDPEIETHKSDIVKIKDNSDIYTAFQTIGIDLKRVLSMFDPVTQSSSKLLNNPSAVALVFRMAVTESLVRVNLAGTVHFFENGGSYSELNPKDIGPFEKRMGKSGKEYKYPLLQIRSFTENHALYLIALHTDTNIKSAFLDSVLK